MSTPDWADLAGDLPTHDGEVMAAHQGAPTIAEQDRTHGTGLPAEDLVMDETAKYGSLPPAC